MKKICSVLICMMLLCWLIPFAPAAGDPPEISMQPQNYHYPEYSVAMYSVKVGGTNLHATWYLEFEGKTYTLSDNQNAMEPWENYAGEAYGPYQDGETFGWFFGGIEAGLNGAEIWCVIEDGHYSVTSARAIVTVQGSVMPPEILTMPAQITASVGEEVVARCVAKSINGEQLAFQWYETTTGRLQDIRAMDGEDCDYIFCDTSKAGTRYFVCCITGSTGGMVYSSVLPVTVKEEAPAVNPPEIVTVSLPQATVGSQYSFMLECTDPAAEFSIWYNPGKSNEFEKTGLELNVQGHIGGTPTKAGTYTFCVCAVGAGGEDYREYTLTIAEAPTEATTTEATTTEATTTEATTAPTTTAPTEATTAPTTTETVADKPQTTDTPDASGEEAGFPVWGYALIALGGITAGIGATFLFSKFRKP